jgi:hypothetical protein
MFTTSLRDIEVRLASFTTTKMYPADYQGTIDNQNEFSRYTVLPTVSNIYNNTRSKVVSGLLIIDIFVEAGKGQSRAFQIADALDLLLQNKILTNKTELGVSYLSYDGLDSANRSLSRYKYTLPFKLYGE